MSYMKRDHDSEHDRGGLSLGGNGQPEEPAPRSASAMPKAPPMLAMGPASAGPTAELTAIRDVSASDFARGDSPDKDPSSSLLEAQPTQHAGAVV